VTSQPPKLDILLLRRQGERWTRQQRCLLRDSRASHFLLECKFSDTK
jgi:hypothetical protein